MKLYTNTFPPSPPPGPGWIYSIYALIPAPCPTSPAGFGGLTPSPSPTPYTESSGGPTQPTVVLLCPGSHLPAHAAQQVLVSVSASTTVYLCLPNFLHRPACFSASCSHHASFQHEDAGVSRHPASFSRIFASFSRSSAASDTILTDLDIILPAFAISSRFFSHIILPADSMIPPSSPIICQHLLSCQLLTRYHFPSSLIILSASQSCSHGFP